ncbi:hypothetical protein V2J09_014391 [Rumex salicifolius]
MAVRIRSNLDGNDNNRQKKLSACHLALRNSDEHVANVTADALDVDDEACDSVSRVAELSGHCTAGS